MRAAAFCMVNHLYGHHFWGYALCVFGYEMSTCDGMESPKIIKMFMFMLIKYTQHICGRNCSKLIHKSKCT